MVDSKASTNKAAWCGVAVELNFLYKPFLTSILAESEDELKALRDISFVQQELHKLHLKCSTLSRRIEFLKGEAMAKDISDEDQLKSKKCKHKFLHPISALLFYFEVS